MAQNEVNKCLIYLKNGNTVDVTRALRTNFTYNPVLDETLDTAEIVLSDMRAVDYPAIDVTTAFQARLPVVISFVGQDTEIAMYISHDDCTLQRSDDTPYRSYTHNIKLIEQIKDTERYPVDTLTFLNPIPRNYDSEATAEWSVVDVDDLGRGQTINTNSWTQPTLNIFESGISTLSINDNASSFLHITGALQRTITLLRLTVTFPNGDTTEYTSPRTTHYDGTRYPYDDSVWTIPTTQTGEYKLSFQLNWFTAEGGGAGNVYHNITSDTYIYIQNSGQSTITPYTLTDVVNRLLAVTPTRTAGENPVFMFDPVQAAEWATEEAPEFAFTGHTLFEALNIIGGYKGAFPQLKNGVISFRKLWNGVRIEESDLPAPYDEMTASDIEQYATHLDSDVQNLVGVNDSQVGSVVEPYAGGWKSTRSQSGSEISQDTAMITTTAGEGVYLQTKTEVGYLQGELLSADDSDITSFLYEEGDYNGLSDTTAAYPMSKAYALKWSQLSNNITELSHIINIPDGTGYAQALQAPALANILRAKTGVSPDTGIVAWIKGLMDMDNGSSFADLMFRTTYIPVINARVKQYKDYFGGFDFESGIKYNQTAELVDSEMFGKHLKELIRKLGNKVKRCVYKFDRVDDVPTVGTVVGDWSIYDVAMTILENRVTATISYVKYAELSKYIGVKNRWKDSDVSTTKWARRYINYSEFMLFTHDGNKEATSTSWSTNWRVIFPFIRVSTNEPLPCTAVKATGYMTDGTALNTVVLPVTSLAIGNSLLFHWQYKDNSSAGEMSEQAPDGATSVISGTKYNRAQKAVKYADNLGRLKNYTFSLMNRGNISYNEATAREIAHALPLYVNKGVTGYPYFTQTLNIDKNGGEQLIFDVQIHNFSDNPNFIIGSGLTNFSPIIGGKAQALGVYAFNERLNIFDRHLNLTGATQINITLDVTDFKITITLPSTINNYNAWAIVGVDKNGNNQIIIGENRDISGADFDTTLYIVPQRHHE